MSRAGAWLVLVLLFVVEVLAVWAIADAGTHLAGWPGGVAAGAAAVALWWAFAAPRALWGRRGTRAVVKTVVFGAATGGILLAGHPVAATALLVLVAVVHALAALPAVRREAQASGHGGPQGR